MGLCKCRVSWSGLSFVVGGNGYITDYHRPFYLVVPSGAVGVLC
jgi:hypothetical protein